MCLGHKNIGSLSWLQKDVPKQTCNVAEMWTNKVCYYGKFSKGASKKKMRSYVDALHRKGIRPMPTTGHPEKPSHNLLCFYIRRA